MAASKLLLQCKKERPFSIRTLAVGALCFVSGASSHKRSAELGTGEFGGQVKSLFFFYYIQNGKSAAQMERLLLLGVELL